MLVTNQPENLPTTNALDNIDKPIQGALIEAAWVKFTGSSHIALEDPPELDVPRTYVVKATCKGVNHALRKDNEERVTVVMEIDSVYERGKVPIVDEQQGSLFDQSADDQDDDDVVDAEVYYAEDDDSNVTAIRPPFSDSEG